jgi:hypothetical protein
MRKKCTAQSLSYLTQLLTTRFQRFQTTLAREVQLVQRSLLVLALVSVRMLLNPQELAHGGCHSMRDPKTMSRLETKSKFGSNCAKLVPLKDRAPVPESY